MGDQATVSSFHRDIGIHINFQEDSGLRTFCSIELHGPLQVSSNVRPPVQMRLGPRASSRTCTEDSDLPLSCEMKDEPAFKPPQGNPTFFRVRESPYPLHVRQQILGPSHILIADGSLLLRCLVKVPTSLIESSESALFSRRYGVHGACLEFLC